ncbi:hypothetical protein VNO77_23293 [Canavalia gladiata]|uniref:Uncharacterized protein n=1 Tax=Canavalia gladiata TaxID=3824 RepID=A0AAN9QBK5_CANGL
MIKILNSNSLHSDIVKRNHQLNRNAIIHASNNNEISHAYQPERCLNSKRRHLSWMRLGFSYAKMISRLVCDTASSWKKAMTLESPRFVESKLQI